MALTQYPWPHCCVHENDSEFMGEPFEWLLKWMNIVDVPTSSLNPQPNTICEQMHQARGKIVHKNIALLLTAMQQTISGRTHKWGTVDNDACAVSNSNENIGSIARRLSFPLIADWALIQQKWQMLINKILHHQNMKQQCSDYIISGCVLMKQIDNLNWASNILGLLWLHKYIQIWYHHYSSKNILYSNGDQH